MRYVFHTHINQVKERRTAVRSRKIGDEIVVDYESLGWFLFVDGFPDSIGVGDAKPEWSPGQKVKITIEENPP